MSKPKLLEFRGVDKVKLALQERVNWLLNNVNTVIANPHETATDDLSKVQIGDTVYNVSGGTQLPFQLVIDENDNGINIVYDDSILNGGE